MSHVSVWIVLAVVYNRLTGYYCSYLFFYFSYPFIFFTTYYFIFRDRYIRHNHPYPLGFGPIPFLLLIHNLFCIALQSVHPTRAPAQSWKCWFSIFVLFLFRNDPQPLVDSGPIPFIVDSFIYDFNRYLLMLCALFAFYLFWSAFMLIIFFSSFIFPLSFII